MDLKTGSLYWNAVTSAETYPSAAEVEAATQPLTGDVECNVLIVGAGVTGALVAAMLADAGVGDVVILDRHAPASGSTPASTALVQYEIDTPLLDLADCRGVSVGRRAYRASRAALDDLDDLIRRHKIDFDSHWRGSLILASRPDEYEAFAAEGAHAAVVYLNEDADARDTRKSAEARGARCLLLRGDIARAHFCRRAVAQTVATFGRLDILINNAAMQFPRDALDDVTDRDLRRTFEVNVFAMFYLTRAVLPHLRRSAKAGRNPSVINTTSVTAYRGSPGLIDYASSKGAIVAFTRSLSGALAADGIRVNAVAPGPIWTPLIPATFDRNKVRTFGADVPFGRARQPSECAGCYVLLAGPDGTYITGQVLHPNDGEIVNG